MRAKIYKLAGIKNSINRIFSMIIAKKILQFRTIAVQFTPAWFLAQKPLVKEVIESRGHKVIFYPKFHCELNFIEIFWDAAKRYAQNNCDYSFNIKALEKIVPEASKFRFFGTNFTICLSSLEVYGCIQKRLNINRYCSFIYSKTI